MKNIKFTKMQAAGNDFIIIDRTSYIVHRISYKLSKLAIKMCDRRFGIGADGLLVLEKSKKCDFKMRIFNPDGSEPQMCGNGLRCIAFLAHKKKIAPASMSIETKAGILSAKISGKKVKIKMTQPKSIKLGLDVSVNGRDYQLYYVDSGVPHAVYYVNKLDNADVYDLGSRIRHHGLFKPRGCNVNFVKASGGRNIKIRTYERGVENETLACGTGAVASAVISALVKRISSPINVYTKGGLLKIYFKKSGNKVKDVFLEGEAEIVFEGGIYV